MIVPKPPVTLEGHCSVVYNNTLYTFSANGFASIPLERNGTWTQLTGGVPVSDAVCVTGGIDGNENQHALYVVGGTSTKANRPGLQRYSFKDKTWKTLQPTDTVASNRSHHNAVYMKSTSSILVYGGHQEDGSIPTSDTFLLETAAPYGISSRPGDNSSPTVSPILLPWNDHQVALIGSSKSVRMFDTNTQEWNTTDITIDKKLSSDVKCGIIRRSDGSKILEVFDMSVSPNTVTSEVLSTPNETKTQKSSQKRKRDNIANYPQYDGTLASTTKRQDYSLAQGDDSLVVISSGSGTDSLAIFNQSSNSWVNATRLFYGDMSEQDILGTTTSPSPTATPTNSVFTPSNSESDSSGTGTSTRTIIGATLGSLLGVAVILVFILFLIKRKKDKMKRAGGGEDIDRDRLSFQDQGVEPLTRSAYPMAKSPAPLAAASVDSLAIFSGRAGDEKSPRPAGALPPYIQRPTFPKSSPLTTIQSSGDYSMGSEYSRDDKAIEAQDSMSTSGPGDRRTNEGWSQYFQDNSATNLANLQTNSHLAATGAQPGSRGTIWPAGSGLPPLNFGFLDQPKPLGQVVSGSPTTEHASISRHIAIPDGQSARISSADSVSVSSEEGDTDHRSPSQKANWQQSWIGRPPSSNYSRSYYNNNHSGRDMPSTSQNYRKHDSARTNTRGSSILIPDGEPLPRNNINSDMSWLNLRGQ